MGNEKLAAIGSFFKRVMGSPFDGGTGDNPKPELDPDEVAILGRAEAKLKTMSKYNLTKSIDNIIGIDGLSLAYNDIRDVLNDIDVKEAIELLDEEDSERHLFSIGNAIRGVASVTSAEEALPMAKMISQSPVFKEYAEKHTSIQWPAIKGISTLAEKAPIEDKLELFEMLEHDGLIGNLLAKSLSGNVAKYITSVFEGIDDDTVSNILINSRALNKVKWSNDLERFFTHLKDERMNEILPPCCKDGVYADMNYEKDLYPIASND